MSSPALLEFKDVSKAFGAVQANQQVSFSVKAGTIHALVGENGAGKSTIVKILFGLYRKDQGEILLNGRPANFNSPLEAKSAGIGMVHQHFMLAGPLTALDHIFLDESQNTSFLSLLRPLPRKDRLQEVEKLSADYGMEVPWQKPIEELSVGFQQRIEILKLLHNKAEILILDEPTAVLTPQEVESLFSQLRELRRKGRTILLITHKLKEVMELADEVTVFRQGRTVGHFVTSQTNPTEISETMVGRKLLELPTVTEPLSAEVAFEVRNLSSPQLALKDLNFRIHQNEIVGIAGVEGNGQTELIHLLLDPQKWSRKFTGDILWKGQSLLKKSAADLKRLGFSYLPNDRLAEGALPSTNLQENFLLGLQHSSEFQNSGWISRGRLRALTEAALERFDVRPRNSELLFQNLSGGNQQKLVVARELFRHPQFLMAAQPTRGVDIGAIERIHSEILELKKKQVPILLISSELDELIRLSDRILVFFKGRIVGDLGRTGFDRMLMGRLMTGLPA